jgi:hypothetical protein
VYEPRRRFRNEQGLLVMFQISTSLVRWVTNLIALAVATAHPAPRHDAQRHHQPVTLPELASASSLDQMR